jgi:hypothetical protein
VIDGPSRRLRRADVGPLVGVSNDQIHAAISLDPCPGEGILGDADAIDRHAAMATRRPMDNGRRSARQSGPTLAWLYDELSARSRLMTSARSKHPMG